MQHATTYEQDYLAWYHRQHAAGEPFDPTSLLHAARVQWAPWPAQAEAFARCTAQWSRDEKYTWFMAPLQRCTHWRFAGNRLLQHPAWGGLVVDLVHDPLVPGGLAIGGIEFLDHVLGRPVDVYRFLAAMVRGV